MVMMLQTMRKGETRIVILAMLVVFACFNTFPLPEQYKARIRQSAMIYSSREFNSTYHHQQQQQQQQQHDWSPAPQQSSQQHMAVQLFNEQVAGNRSSQRSSRLNISTVTKRASSLDHQGEHKNKDDDIIISTSESSDPFLQQMLLPENHDRLRLSASHQRKLLSQKSNITNVFPPSALYVPRSGKFSSVVLNQNWAYLHIWKSGGSTMAKQTGRRQMELKNPIIQKRDWMTLVRDPIEHFLSGWAECGVRLRNPRLPHGGARPWNASEFDGRIRKHLNLTRNMAMDLLDPRPQKIHCYQHSFPQGNFLLSNESAPVHDKLKVIGDLREIVDVLKEVVGFEYDRELGEARTAADNGFKKEYFKVRKDLLSNETMLAICKYVAIDYFLFDFPLPKACENMWLDWPRATV